MVYISLTIHVQIRSFKIVRNGTSGSFDDNYSTLDGLFYTANRRPQNQQHEVRTNGCPLKKSSRILKPFGSFICHELGIEAVSGSLLVFDRSLASTFSEHLQIVMYSILGFD